MSPATSVDIAHKIGKVQVPPQIARTTDQGTTAPVTALSAGAVEPSVPSPGSLTEPRPGWQRRALCAGMTERFFPDRMRRDQVRTAKNLCLQCPVRTECLEMALGFDTDRHGIFGGLTPRERRLIRESRSQDQAGHR